MCWLTRKLMVAIHTGQDLGVARSLYGPGKVMESDPRLEAEYVKQVMEGFAFDKREDLLPADREVIKEVIRRKASAFWDEDSSSTDAPTLTVEPAAGVGVVFNGAVKHAGRSVTEGVRHVLVASFSIADAAPTAGARPA